MTQEIFNTQVATEQFLAPISEEHRNTVQHLCHSLIAANIFPTKFIEGGYRSQYESGPQPGEPSAPVASVYSHDLTHSYAILYMDHPRAMKFMNKVNSGTTCVAAHIRNAPAELVDALVEISAVPHIATHYRAITVDGGTVSNDLEDWVELIIKNEPFYAFLESVGLPFPAHVISPVLVYDPVGGHDITTICEVITHAYTHLQSQTS